MGQTNRKKTDIKRGGTRSRAGAQAASTPLKLFPFRNLSPIFRDAHVIFAHKLKTSPSAHTRDLSTTCSHTTSLYNGSSEGERSGVDGAPRHRGSSAKGAANKSFVLLRSPLLMMPVDKRHSPPLSKCRRHGCSQEARESTWCLCCAGGAEARAPFCSGGKTLGTSVRFMCVTAFLPRTRPAAEQQLGRTCRQCRLSRLLQQTRWTDLRVCSLVPSSHQHAESRRNSRCT